ncbi:hypothetical protein AJ79_06544 [Helicocarpus griseus UAMH5409]|uniref:Fungal-type protein kinase domain-containing protein n=1 Tax=Helicocarpus griseus UAMH5409 TaxID=1447875 RepID=A0A2B7X488_9EURO|nr:hypothetical protein AJ79_06544 [Helicocarpus griseus UAMH5409]
MIRTMRKREGREDAAVYGTTTDGNVFRFWKVDEGLVTSSILFEWDHGQAAHITSFIRFFVREAIALASPLKRVARRDVKLSVFKTVTPEAGEGELEDSLDYLEV